jgi:hypothetical protein
MWIALLVLILVGCQVASSAVQELPGTSAPTPAPTEEVSLPLHDQDDAIARAIADLQEQLGVGAADVAVGDVAPVEFPDPSLGVPEPGMSYAQVITPGYVIRLVVAGKTYEYRAGGEHVVLVPEVQDPNVGEPRMPPLPGQETYQRVEIADTGLSLELPAGWLRLDPEWAWMPAEGSDLRLGVNWIDLQPPMEPEAALLPNHAQVLSSEQVTLSWGQGRRVVLEVYAPAAQGADVKAPVESVQIHVLVVVDQDGARRGYDFYAIGGTAEELAGLEPLLAHVLETSTLELAQ